MEEYYSMDMDLAHILPFLRYIHYIELIPEFTSHIQIGYDQRLFYCINGNYAMTADHQIYTLNENSLLYIPSGVPYHLHTPQKNVLLVGINFDFSINFSHHSIPVVPASGLENFQKENQFEQLHFTDVPQFNAPFLLNDQHQMLSLIQQMLEEYTTKRFFFAEKISALLKQLLSSAARTLMTGFAPSPQKTVDLVIRYIQANYKRHISNGDIGNELNFHPNYLNRLMLQHTGKSLHQYLLNYRLTKALDLLQSTSMTVTEVASETGFSDVHHFARFFQKQTGCTPGSFK